MKTYITIVLAVIGITIAGIGLVETQNKEKPNEKQLVEVEKEHAWCYLWYYEGKMVCLTKDERKTRH